MFKRVILLTTVAAVTAWGLPWLSAAAEARQEPVMCHGRPATIVGTVDEASLLGTPGPDVIVVGEFEGNLVDGRGGNDLICGSAGPDYLLLGGPGDDHIWGSGGYDAISGGEGADSLHAGPDTLIDFVWGGAGPDRIFGGRGEDVLSGGTGDDHIWGGDGVDELFGGEGNDVEHGGAGSDRLLGDPGRDRLWGGPGTRDVVDYGLKWTGWEGGARHHIATTVNLRHGVASARWFGHDQVRGFTQVWTGPGDDHVIGDASANTFFTGLGQDVIHGGGGIDTVRFDVPTLFDDGPEGSFLNVFARVSVDLAAHSAVLSRRSGVVGQERLYGVDNVIGTDRKDTILGNDRSNVLRGAASAGRYNDNGDSIDGRGGDDSIFGQGGDDTLDGGPGANVIDGGYGTDTCLNPATGPTVSRCELTTP